MVQLSSWISRLPSYTQRTSPSEGTRGGDRFLGVGIVYRPNGSIGKEEPTTASTRLPSPALRNDEVPTAVEVCGARLAPTGRPRNGGVGAVWPTRREGLGSVRRVNEPPACGSRSANTCNARAAGTTESETGEDAAEAVREGVLPGYGLRVRRWGLRACPAASAHDGLGRHGRTDREPRFDSWVSMSICAVIEGGGAASTGTKRNGWQCFETVDRPTSEGRGRKLSGRTARSMALGAPAQGHAPGRPGRHPCAHRPSASWVAWQGTNAARPGTFYRPEPLTFGRRVVVNRAWLDGKQRAP